MFLEREEKKFTILYTLTQFAEPVSMARLIDILTGKEIGAMDYFSLAELINELHEDGYTDTKYYRNDLCFFVTEKGKDTNDYFSRRVPGSIRRGIDLWIREFRFEEGVNPDAVLTEIRPVAERQYEARMTMLENNCPMLEIRLFAGNKQAAVTAAKKMKDQADDIYRDLIERIQNKKKEGENNE